MRLNNAHGNSPARRIYTGDVSTPSFGQQTLSVDRALNRPACSPRYPPWRGASPDSSASQNNIEGEGDYTRVRVTTHYSVWSEGTLGHVCSDPTAF